MRMLFVALLFIASPAQAAERILALTPHACETLFAIGAGDEVVGAGEFCDEPHEARSLPRVANFSQVYTEAALRLKPTLAVVLDPALSGLETLRHAGIRVVSSDPQSVAEVFADIRRIGKASGHAAAARKLAGQLEKQLHQMHGLQQGQRLSVYYEIWEQPLMAVGGVGFLADVIHQAGLTNIFAAVAREGVRINPESVVRAAPQLIIVTGKGEVVAKRRTYWRKWLPGVRLLAVDASLMHRPGPRIVDAIAMLRQQVRSLKVEAMPR